MFGVVTDLTGAAGKSVITASQEFGDAAPDAEIIARAREGLSSARTAHRIDDRLYETVVGSDLNIAVFGAGHVGSAVVRSLSALDLPWSSG